LRMRAHSTQGFLDAAEDLTVNMADGGVCVVVSA